MTRALGLQVVKAKGRLQVLSDLIQGGSAVQGSIGVGHTRWATHGAPSDINSHPQGSVRTAGRGGTQRNH